MSLTGITGQLWTVATTTYGISVGALVSVCVACWVVIKWQNVKAWVEDHIRGKSEIKLKYIFNEYLKKVASIRDRRELYGEILKIVSRLANSDDLSLLLKSPSTRKYVVRESVGSKPMSFQINEVDNFIEWMRKYKRSITRAELVESSEFAKVKSSGLQYCVQFHAEAVIPLILSDEMIGLINIGCRSDGRDFEDYLFEIFDLMSAQFAVAIHNANLYEGLIRQNVKLRQLDELKTQLLSNISHELRTPLNAIIGLSELLSDGSDGELTDEQSMHANMIKNSGERLLDTVNALVDLSKLEANKLDLNVKRISLKRMIEEAKTLVGPTEKVQITAQVDDSVPAVYGDAIWLIRVFKNILSNAIKYTPKGKIHIDFNRAGDMITIGVHDTGIGINKEDQKRIFDGFVQADGRLDRSYEGTGLGLAISKKIVELHGGRIWLNSKPGKGSHFFFTLPLKPTAIPSAELAS